MKLKNVIQTKLAKTLVAALLIGSVSNTGFTVQAEEATQNEQNDVVEMASVSGNDSSVAVGTMAKYVGGQVASPNVWPNNYKPANGDFSLFAGHKMTLDDAETFKYLSVDNTGVDAEGKLTGSNGASWQCVGFVALDVNKYSDCKPADLLHYVYYGEDSEGTSYYKENCGKQRRLVW